MARAISKTSLVSRSLYLATAFFGHSKTSTNYLIKAIIGLTSSHNRVMDNHGKNSTSIEENVVRVDLDSSKLDSLRYH